MTLCDTPEDVAHASHSGSSYSVGDKVVYTCDVGYTHKSGDLERTCQDNGEWSGVLPVCEGRQKHFQVKLLCDVTFK